MSMKRRVFITVASAAAACGFASRARAAEPIRIGAINPYSGPAALYGDETTRGYELAASLLNAKGGLLGRQIEMVRGNAANPQEAMAAVEQLAGRDKVDAFIGTYISAVSDAASESALNNSKLYWDTNALAAQLTTRGLPNFIRSGPNSTDFANESVLAITDLVAKGLGKPVNALKVWVQHEDSIYGTTIAKDQLAGLQKAGAQIVGDAAYSARAIDQTDVILRAKSADPDVWLSTGYTPDSNLMLRTARDQGFKPRAMLITGSGDTFETRDALGKEFLEGILIVTYPRADINPAYGPGAADYLAAYKAKYNRDPIAPQNFTAYVGAQMMFEAIAVAGSTDFEKVRDAAAKMDKPLGSYANGFGVKFDSQMQNTRAKPIVGQWQNGLVVTVFPEKAVPAGGKLVNLARV
jgi:branched-chain amino acid transport system substrate-binding protein